MRKINKWCIVNWHYILNRDWDSILFKCWRCKAISKKHRQNLYKHKWCNNCAMWNQKLDFSLRTKCWILWLYLPTIKSRIQRWWTVTEALYEEKRVHKEQFNEKDMSYLNKFYTKNYKEDNELAKKLDIDHMITKL